MIPFLSRAAAFVAIATLGVAIARAAHADERPHVTWIAPAACPTEDDVVTLVGHSLGHEWPEGVEAHASVAQKDNGHYAATIVIVVQGTSGERALEATSCVRLANAAAIVIATAADAVAEAATAPRPPPPITPPPPPVPPPKPAALPAARRAPASKRPRHLRAGAELLAIAGVFPRGTLGVGATVSYVLRRVELDAGLLYYPEQAVHDGPRPGAGADLQLFGALVRGCRRAGDFPPELRVCLGVEGGAYEGRGFGLVRSESTVQPWVALTGGLAVRRRVTPRLAWSTGVDVGLSLVRPSFGIDGFGTIARTSLGLGQLKAGVEFDFF